MYIYHTLINALSAQIMHINLNVLFYTHVEHSPIKNSLDKVLYRNTHTPHNELECAWHWSVSYFIHHTHTHTCTHACTHTDYDCSRNWVLILVGWKYCEKRKVFSLALKDDRVEQCLRSGGNEFQIWGPMLLFHNQMSHTFSEFCFVKNQHTREFETNTMTKTRVTYGNSHLACM